MARITYQAKAMTRRMRSKSPPNCTCCDGFDKGVCEGIREEEGGHDKAHADKYEQGATDTPPASSDHRAHPLEETEREKDEQETHDDEISDLYPAARPKEQVADRLPYGRITRPECAINCENQAIEDRSNDSRPDAEAQGETPCSSWSC